MFGFNVRKAYSAEASIPAGFESFYEEWQDACLVVNDKKPLKRDRARLHIFYNILKEEYYKDAQRLKKEFDLYTEEERSLMAEAKEMYIEWLIEQADKYGIKEPEDEDREPIEKQYEFNINAKRRIKMSDKEINKKKAGSRVKLSRNPEPLPRPGYDFPVPKIESTPTSFFPGTEFLYSSGSSTDTSISLKIPDEQELFMVYVEPDLFTKAFNLDPNTLTEDERIKNVKTFYAAVNEFVYGNKISKLLIKFLRNAVSKEEMKKLGCIGFKVSKKLAKQIDSIKGFIRLDGYIDTIEPTVYGLGGIDEIEAIDVLKSIVGGIVEGRRELAVPKVFMKSANSYLGRELSNSALDIMEFCIAQIAPVIAKTGSTDLIDVLDLMIRAVDSERGKIYRSYDTFPIDYSYITGYSNGIS